MKYLLDFFIKINFLDINILSISAKFDFYDSEIYVHQSQYH